MTVENTNREISYTGNDSVTVFAYDFLVYSDDHLFVYFDDVVQTVGFTFDGIGDDDGGDVTFVIPPATGVEVKFERIVPFTQLIEYQQYGPFDAKSNERGLDLAAMRDIQIDALIDELSMRTGRSIRVPDNDPVSEDNLITDSSAVRAGKVLGFNSQGEVVSVEITTETALLNFVRTKLTVVPGQLEYLLPTSLDSQNVVVVGGKILPEGAYSASIPDGNLVLSVALNTEGLMFEVWNRLISPSDAEGISAKSFGLPINATTTTLANVKNIGTRDGVVLGDNFGATFIDTETPNIPSAGTIDVGSAIIYDLNGRAFKLVGNKVKLEQLGVPYTETSATVLGYIVELRVNGFEVNVSTEYNLTQADSRKNIQNNVKQWIIHRGLQDIAPENTMLAFSMAYNRMKGQNIAFECDVQITADGIPVVYHDVTLDTLTDGTGLIKDVTFAYLQTLKFNEMAGVFGEDLVHIPSFDEFMEYAAEVGVDVHPEIKEYRTIDDVSLMIDIIQKYKMSAMTYIGSFRLEDVVKARDLDQQINIDYIKEAALTGEEITVLTAIGNITILGSVSYITNNPVDVAIIQSKGWDIVAWTIDRIETMIDVSKLGIQKIIVDRNLMPTGDMTTISSPCRLNRRPWGNIADGGGTVVMTANPENNQSVGEVATCEVTGIGGNARVRLPFNISAGEIIKLTIFAANVGGHPDEATIDVDRPTGNRKNTLNINSTELKEYEISYQAPWNTSFAAYDGGFDLGVPNTRDAGAVFFNPMVSSSYSRMGGTRTVMMGCIVIAQGGVAGMHRLDTQTASINIDGEEINPAGDTRGIIIRPQKETQLSTNFGEQYPNAYVAPVNTNQDTTPWVFDCNARFSTGHIEVFARDMITGATINLATTTSEHRFYFKVEI